MFSMAFGAQSGVSKRAAVTIVRLPKAIRALSEWNPDTIPAFRIPTPTHALVPVLQDIQQRGIKNKAVVNLSLGGRFGFNRVPVLGELYWDAFVAAKDLIDRGVTITVAAGNKGEIAKFGVCSPPLLHTLNLLT